MSRLIYFHSQPESKNHSGISGPFLNIFTEVVVLGLVTFRQIDYRGYLHPASLILENLVTLPGFLEMLDCN